eukprot:scaffold504891_cov38-Prasinocladus_malaysianus.AAC.1
MEDKARVATLPVQETVGQFWGDGTNLWDFARHPEYLFIGINNLRALQLAGQEQIIIWRNVVNLFACVQCVEVFHYM